MRLRRIKKGYGRRPSMGAELSLWFGAGIVVGGVGLVIYRVTQGKWPWTPATQPTPAQIAAQTGNCPDGYAADPSGSGKCIPLTTALPPQSLTG